MKSFSSNKVLRHVFKRQTSTLDFALSRRNMQDLLLKGARLAQTPPGVSVSKTRLADIPCTWIRAKGVEPNNRELIVYCHGGAFTAGSARSHEDIAWRLSQASGSPVLSIDYRLAPEFPFPSGFEDVHMVYQSLINEGFSSEKISVAGDSAGANLLLSLMVHLRDEGEAYGRALHAAGNTVRIERVAGSNADKPKLRKKPVFRHIGRS